MKIPSMKRNCKCTFCDRNMKILWKIADPNLDMSDDIPWLDMKSWWYVCNSCKKFIKEKQDESFNKWIEKYEKGKS